MNVSFYLPVGTIGWVVLTWLAIGIILFVPIALWQNRFISSKPKGLSNVKIFRGLVLSSLFWPSFLVYSAITEIKYRKKGYL